MLMLCATLATHSLIGDNLTYDEVIHLTGGLSILETGDFRLALGTPPLAQVWAALPVWLSGVDWPPADLPAWRDSDVFGVGRAWFYDLNDGESLLVGARLMIVALLLATCAMTYRVAHDLFGVVAARVSLALAALSPTLLAHGRLVTTDLPAALAFLLSVWTFAGAIAPCRRRKFHRSVPDEVFVAVAPARAAHDGDRGALSTTSASNSHGGQADRHRCLHGLGRVARHLERSRLARQPVRRSRPARTARVIVQSARRARTADDARRVELGIGDSKQQSRRRVHYSGVRHRARLPPAA
jgi:hypothetical protein